MTYVDYNIFTELMHFSDAFVWTCLEVSLRPEFDSKVHLSNLSIIFTELHGTVHSPRP